MRSIGKEIKDIDNLMFRKLIKNTPEHKYMSPVQFSVLKHLLCHQDKVYQKDIEQELHLRRSTVSGILDTMEKNNMIIRKTNIDDSRKKEIVLTEFVYSKANEIREKMKEFDKLLLKGISEEDLEIFYKVIDQLKSNLKEEN